LQHVVDNRGQVEGILVVQAALAAGQGEQRLDELFLFVLRGEDVVAG
jgi:hypothetical protein